MHYARRPLSSLLSLVSAAVLASLAATPASASHIGESLSTDQQYVSANDQLLNALAQWEKMPASVRDARIAQLTTLAAHRQEHLLLLLEKNPKVAAARMMPKELRSRLPAQAAAYVESEVSLQGAVFADVADNFAQGVARTNYKFQPSTGGAAMNLDLSDAMASERDMLKWVGKKLSLKGMQIADHLALLDKNQVQVEAAGSTTTTTTTSTGTVTASSTAVQGDQKTLSILVNFSDKPVSCTTADVASRLFGSTGTTVNNNYKESSRGLVSFSGSAVGPFTIPYTRTGSCNYQGRATAAEAAAKAAGIDPTQYAHVNYVTPSNGTCGWTGLAYMPGRQSWVQACSSTGTFSHELGHNLSFNHAATPTSEYGDGSDPMGGAKLVDHNGANRTMAGWMPAGTVTDVSSGGSYALTTVSNVASVGTAQVLRFAKADTSEFYYVSLREAMNLDSALASTYVNTVTVHRATGTLPAKTYLLQNLALGQSFTDATNGITITNQGTVSGVATVSVTMSGPVCTRVAPSVSVSPASQTANPGAARSYTVSVRNNNASACGTTSFGLKQVSPAGFTASLSATTLSLGAGATGSATLTETSSASSLDGTYTLDAVATDASNSLYTTTAHASYVVYHDTTAPTISITSPLAGSTTTVSGGKSSLSIGATASDASGIKLVEFYGDGVLLAQDTASPYTASWNLRKLSKGLHVVKVRATDNLGNVAEKSNSFTVN